MIAKIYREGERDYLWFWCDGCKTHHRVPVSGEQARTWQFNGDVAKPTLRPSILVTLDFGGDDNKKKVCHSLVTDGKIQYLGDSTHYLANQTIDLPELP